MRFNASNPAARRSPPAGRSPVPSRRRATTPAPRAILSGDGGKNATGTTGLGLGVREEEKMAVREPQRVRDLISQQGAETLARELTEYWRQRGHTEVQFWIVPLRSGNWHSTGTTKQAPVWGVRGNLVRGLPPKAEAPR